MGKFSRDKGARFEREIVHIFQACGIAAERVPLSGAARGKFSSDVSVPLGGADYRVEVKVRKNGFKMLYDWLYEVEGNQQANDALVIKSDREEPLLVVPLRKAAHFIELFEKMRDGNVA